MDASQITKMLQKQNNKYINRCQTVDSSTLTWTQQLKSSSYIQGVRTCGGTNAVCNVPTQPGCVTGNGICNYGGQGKSTTLMTGATQQFPNVFASATGSATRVYSSDNIVLQKASNNICGDAPTYPAPQNSYVVTEPCPEICSNTNYSKTVVNNQSNPYLPAVDTYYALKNPCYPSIDQNQTHYLQKCNKCPTDTGMASIDSNHTYVIEQPGEYNPSISYNLPDCPIDQGTTITYPVIFGPGTPLGGTFSITLPGPGPGSNPATINSITGALTIPSNIPPGINPSGLYIITYTINSTVLSTSLNLQGC